MSNNLLVILITVSLCSIFASVAAMSFKPGDKAQPFIFHTLNGVVDYIDEKTSKHLLPMIFYAYDSHSAFVEALWTKNDSVNALIANSTMNGNYVFMSYSDNALKDVDWMKKRLNNHITDMYIKGEIDAQRAASLTKRMHFVVLPVNCIGNWISSILSQWACQGHGCGFDQIVVSTASTYPYVINRLDARYDWLPSPGSAFGNRSMELVKFNACKNTTNMLRASGKIAIAQHQSGCSYYKMVKTALAANATGIIVVAANNEYVVDMHCQGDQCNIPLGVPATMISFADGKKILDMLKANKKVHVAFQTTSTHNFYFGIDGQGKIAEAGWLLYPSFLYLIWQLEWFNFNSELLHNISLPAKVVKVFDDKSIQGKYGASAFVKLPSVDDMLQYQDVQLDMALSCKGDRDNSCPPWDHTVQLYVCCSNGSSYCHQELGRWITAFRRRIGHWLTSVNALLPLLSTDKCNFTAKTVPWAQPWFITLNIRFSNRINPATAKKKGTPLKPQKVIPLFRGGTFDKTYNTKYKPIHFNVSTATKKIKLVAVITGHGSDNNNCAEFCVTSHHFIVNGKHHNVRTFNNAGTALGCARRVSQGVTPNEHGTWLYGRDGWCDGEAVKPWEVDITSQVDFKSVNSITYHGYYNNADPHPTSSPGRIKLYSFLSFYGTY